MDLNKVDAQNYKSARFDKHRTKNFTKFVNFDYKVDKWFDLQDFSWESHAYDLFSKYVPETADAYSNAMNFAFEMTKQNYGLESIDTSYFRLTIRRYLMNIHGIRDDAFNYKTVN